MADYTAKKIDDIEAHHAGRLQARPRGARRRVVRHAGDRHAAELRRTIPSTITRRPARKRSTWCCAGSAEMDVDGERVQIDPDTIIRVGAEREAQDHAGRSGRAAARAGRNAGRVYEAPEITQLGTPDPTLAQT